MLIDILFVFIIFMACIKGYRKGLVIAVFSIIAFVAGIAAALKLSTVVADHFRDSVNVSAKWLPFLSFVIVFLAVVLLVQLGGKLIEKTFQLALLGWLNRLGGILFFAALYIIIFSVFLFYAEKLNLFKLSVIHSSQTYAFVQPWGPKLIDGIGKLIPFFKDMFSELETFFSSLPDKIPH